VAEWITCFLNEAPPRLAAIAEAVEREDPQALYQAAHALKGEADILGARGIHSLCARLEELGRAATMAGAKDLVHALEQALRQIRTPLLMA
jgi:HPt (histidine-containing phosphotransfer) domain-containing protein